MKNLSFIAKFAGHCVKIDCLHNETKEFCSKYIVNEKPDCSISINEQDILNEKENAIAQQDENKCNIYLQCDNFYYEQLALYRKIATKFLDYDILLFHGSAIKVNGKGYIFTGKSGIGKSTHAALWRKYLGIKALMINDDKPLIMVNDNMSFVYGTPWDGKHKLSENTFAPIEAICILNQAKNNKIIEVKKMDAFINIMQQVYLPDDKKSIDKILSLVEKLLKNARMYKLQCNMDIEAAKIAYEKMNGN